MKIVNIEKAVEEFIKYANNYELTNANILRKKEHSLRVMEISAKLAQEENFTEEEIEVATLIGLLHDIARFKQYTEYKTFSDHQSFDHGDVAVQILEENNYLRKFIETNQYDEIIKLAIKNHNKFKIEEGITDVQNKFCMLIRDADKIDILYLATNYFWNNAKEEMENSKINPELKKEFEEKRALLHKNYKQIKYADQIIQFFAYVFDLNYKSSFEAVKEKQYIDKIINRFNFQDRYTQDEIIKAGEETKKYILKKIEE